ncbi:MAG: OmpA family protein [Chlamydiales bacterium]
MKKNVLLMTLACSSLTLIFSSCSKKNKTWDDSTSSGSYRDKHSQSLWGNDGESEIAQEDFIPLNEEDLKSQFADGAIPQAKHDLGSGGIPGVDQFQTPTAELASIFHQLYFNTDEHILRSPESLTAVDRIASYLKSHPHMHIVVEGHCDERAPEAYNLSLGARRANYVRTLLVKKGADLNQIHTISYGKERPAELGHGPDSWSRNRRAEFKVHQQR